MSNAGLALQRSTLREQIADALRDEILTGRLPAGGRFTVKEIAELYGVSATPVREALVDLAAQGLLEVEQHRGFQVRRFTWVDYVEIAEARNFVVEGLFRRAADRGMRKAPAEALASVRRRGEAAARAARAGELDVLIGCDLRFWRELATLSGNAKITDFLHKLRIQTWMFAVPLLRDLPDLDQVCWHDYVALADAIAAGDVEASQRITEEYGAHFLQALRGLDEARR
jgi:DNA-binding GntR family transcriptional regulator